MNKFSILHISDLHKLEGTNYKALLQSLLTDRDTYVGAGVTIPKYVVVSGDLIHGGSTEDEIRRQYAETLGFLTEVTDEFLDGNKKRMLIVPGNHDVSFPHSKNSMSTKSKISSCFGIGILKLDGTGRISRFTRLPIRMNTKNDSTCSRHFTMISTKVKEHTQKTHNLKQSVIPSLRIE